MTDDDIKEVVITEADYRDYLSQRLRLQGKACVEIDKIGFPFLLVSGSEMLRSYILAEANFTESLLEEYKLPDRGFLWYLFSQSVQEIHATAEEIVIRYRLLDFYRKPFKQFYL